MLQVIAIGRLRDAPEAALFARYADRMRPKLGLIELPEARGAAAEVKRREGAALLEALPAKQCVVPRETLLEMKLYHELALSQFRVLPPAIKEPGKLVEA